METYGDIQTYVKQDQRLSGTDMDAFILSRANKNYLRRTRAMPWQQLLVESGSFTTTANVATYALPTNFFRLIPNSVRYSTTSGDNGMPLPDVPERNRVAWKSIDSTNDPSVCAIVGSGTSSSGKSMELLPTPSSGSSTVMFDYYCAVSSFSGTASTAQVPQILEVVAYDTIADVARYMRRTDEATEAMMQAKELYKEASRGLTI